MVLGGHGRKLVPGVVDSISVVTQSFRLSVKELLPSGTPARETFASEFLALIEVDNEWPWKIYVVRRSPFPSDRICQYTELPNMGTQQRIHSQLNQYHFILQRSQCGAARLCGWDHFYARFRYSSVHCKSSEAAAAGTFGPSRSPGLNPCDFWLLGYLKDVVFSAPIAHLAEMKSCIAQHILNVIPDTLRSVMEHALFLDLNLQTTVDSILNMLCSSLTKFKNRFEMNAFYAVFGLMTFKNRFLPSDVI
ncbi:uncharacterized protein TNCV_3778591 [Trichonephila clavipes]|nr:uncharacterized protein TNCV_3778591 [Trichonephila clavipes]